MMKIAVTYENGQVFQHFGHCEQFKLYDVQDGQVVSSQVVSAAGSGHGALAGFLAARDVSIVICGNMGAGAQNALTEAGIQFFGGVAGNTDDRVQEYLEGRLCYQPNISCSHHGGHGGSCGGHHEGSCGGHEHCHH